MTDAPKPPGPAGAPCPVCGHALYLHVVEGSGCGLAECACDVSPARREFWEPLSAEEAARMVEFLRARPAPAAPESSALPEPLPLVASRPEIELPPQRLAPEVVASMIVTSHLSVWGPLDVRRNRDLTALISAVAAGIAEDRRTPEGPFGRVVPEEMATAAPEMKAILRDVLAECDDPDGRLGALKLRMEQAGLRALLDRIDKAGR